jgi:hypothetical protein
VNPAFASIVGAVAIGKGIGLNLIVGLAPVAAGIWIATTRSAPAAAAVHINRIGGHKLAGI